MRTTLLKLFFPLSLLLCISSCSLFDFDFSPDLPNPPNTTDSTEIANIVQMGDWVITYFNDSGDNDTHHFTGFSFTFNDDGSLVAANNSTTHIGLWSITDHHSNSNHHSNDEEFNINFDGPNHFDDLSEDWDIISTTDTHIELIHISGGNGGIDYLTFDRI